MGQNGAVLGQMPHFGPFWPISLRENQQKGCQKRWEISPHQIYFSKLRMVWYHKGSPPVLFWDEKRPWLRRGGL